MVKITAKLRSSLIDLGLQKDVSKWTVYTGDFSRSTIDSEEQSLKVKQWITHEESFHLIKDIGKKYVRSILFNYVKSLTTNVPHHIETSQLICIANQLTDFYMIGNIGR